MYHFFIFINVIFFDDNTIIIFNINIFIIKIIVKFLMGIGDWGLGIGPNPQSPIPIKIF